MYNTQLETFIKVADVGSFSKAANELHVTSTAIIKQINNLEADLDVKLFIRTHRGIQLTEAGKSLYEDAKHIIQYSKDSISRAKNAMLDRSNIIRIGTSHMTPGQFLVDLWSKLYEICPELKFKLVAYESSPENAKKILENLGQDIDIVARVFDEELLQARECAALELSKEPIRCAVPVGHRLASKDKLTIQDLYGESFMMIRRKWNSYVDVLRDDLLNHPEINIVDIDYFNVSIFNQCENDNATIMSLDAWRNVHPLFRTIPVEWAHCIPYGILHPAAPSETVQKFLDAIQSINL